MNLPFLLEIGTEEIPDWMIERGLAQLKENVEGIILQNELNYGAVAADATPRRLTIEIRQVQERRDDKPGKLFKGPLVAEAYVGNTPTKAAIGFARKHGIPVTELGVVQEPSGDRIAYRPIMPGKDTRTILSEALPSAILNIHWPKTMYWVGGKNGPRFIRPIRWLVALLGGDIVPFEVAGLHSGDVTRGRRRSGAGPIPVTVDNYRALLSADDVILSASERRKQISDGIETLLRGTDLRIHPDPDLLNTLVYITEFPTPILGSFDEQYLELPSEVLVTVMRHHQKYFSVDAADGKLAPRFIAVMNIDADRDGLVRRGNERVLRARFNDARFFWQMDQHKKLADRVADLANVTFQTKLGSYLEKTKRTQSLAGELAAMAAVDAAPVERAAHLLKADLTTEMVKEFTELQGVVGGLYAKVQGEREEVWRAIYDQYKPESMEDAIPATVCGRLVALADKLDTLRGCFGIGLVPTGSKDPFALRRAAQGVVRILVEGKLELPLSKLIAGDQQLRDFVLDRIKYYFREVRGFAYDEVNAVLASGTDNLPDIEARLTALKAVRPTANFEPLAASFKRIQNILRQAGFEGGGAVNESLLEAGPEQQLYNEFQRVRDTARATEYLPALEAIASLRPAVDLFFDKVLVNVQDPNVRRNRLALLSSILTEFSTIADFSEIVTQ